MHHTTILANYAAVDRVPLPPPRTPFMVSPLAPIRLMLGSTGKKKGKKEKKGKDAGGGDRATSPAKVKKEHDEWYSIPPAPLTLHVRTQTHVPPCATAEPGCGLCLQRMFHILPQRV